VLRARPATFLEREKKKNHEGKKGAASNYHRPEGPFPQKKGDQKKGRRRLRVLPAGPELRGEAALLQEEKKRKGRGNANAGLRPRSSALYRGKRGKRYAKRKSAQLGLKGGEKEGKRALALRAPSHRGKAYSAKRRMSPVRHQGGGEESKVVTAGTSSSPALLG